MYFPSDQWEAPQVEPIAARAIRTLENAETKWVDVDAVGKLLAGRKLIAVRKSRRLTQIQLGKLVGVPQSQISRLERNPESATIKFLRRVAKALKVDVAELL